MLDKTIARHFAFGLFSGVALLAFHAPFYAILDLSLRDARYTHIAVMPLVCASVIYCGQKRIFEKCERRLRVGIPILALGTILSWAAKDRSAGRSDDLWLVAFAMVLVWIAGFIGCYGTKAFRAALFPFGLLLLVIPIPTPLLDGINSVLQRGSAEVTFVLLKLAGVPVLRDGFRFSLPGLEIEVAEECSGLRSAFGLSITGLLAGHALLRTAWGRVSLGLLTVPIAIVKNAFRIATLSWLASYVDEGYMHGNLHHRGGLPFALLALALLVPAILVLRRSELRFFRVAGKT
jgi:exosortase